MTDFPIYFEFSIKVMIPPVPIFSYPGGRSGLRRGRCSENHNLTPPEEYEKEIGWSRK